METYYIWEGSTSADNCNLRKENMEIMAYTQMTDAHISNELAAHRKTGYIVITIFFKEGFFHLYSATISSFQ